MAGLVSVLGTFGSQAQDSIEYMVQGAVERTSLMNREGKHSYFMTNRVNFELFVRGNEWLVTLLPQEPDIHDYRTVVSSDGEDLYLLLSFAETLSSRNRNAAASPSNVVNHGTVAKGNVPRFGVAEEAGAIWLAYASHSQWARESGQECRPVPFAQYVRRPPVEPGDLPVLQTAIWKASGQPSFLPLRVSYVTDDFEALGIRKESLKFSNNAFTNVIYETKAFLETNGLLFPRESMASIFGIFSDPGAGETVKLAESMRITATNIVLNAAIDSFQPEIRRGTIINEERFNNNSGLSFAYLSTHYWPDENEVRNSPPYREALAARGLARPRAIQHPAFLLLSVGIVSLFGFFIRRQNKHMT